MTCNWISNRAITSRHHFEEVTVGVHKVDSAAATEGIGRGSIRRIFRIVPEGYSLGTQSIHDRRKSRLIDAKGDVLARHRVRGSKEQCPGRADGEALHLTFRPGGRCRR